MKTLKAALQEACLMELEDIPSEEALSTDETLTFSKAFERKMKKLIQTQRRSPGLNRFISASKRIAVIALAVLTVSFSCLMCVEAYREKFLEIISKVFEDLTQYTFFSTWNGNSELDEIEFDYLPVGMSELGRDYSPQSHYQAIWFEDSMGHRFEISQDIMTSNKQSTMILDTENAETTKIDFNGYDATLITKDEQTMFLCVDDFSYILLSGDFLPEEIIKIANGVNILKK